MPHLWFGGGYGAPPADSPWRFDSHRALLGPHDGAAEVESLARPTRSGLRSELRLVR